MKEMYMPIHKYVLLCKDIFKYGLVSSVALAVDVGFLYALVEYAFMHYLVAATIAFCLGLAVNYILGKKYVFKNSRMPAWQEFIWYAAIGVIGLILNDLIIYILVWLQLWYMFAKAISVAIVFFFNFFGRRRLFAE